MTLFLFLYTSCRQGRRSAFQMGRHNPPIGHRDHHEDKRHLSLYRRTVWGSRTFQLVDRHLICISSNTVQVDFTFNFPIPNNKETVLKAAESNECIFVAHQSGNVCVGV